MLPGGLPRHSGAHRAVQPGAKHGIWIMGLFKNNPSIPDAYSHGGDVLPGGLPCHSGAHCAVQPGAKHGKAMSAMPFCHTVY